MASSVEVAVPVAPTAPVKLTGPQGKYSTDKSQVITVQPAADIRVGGADVTVDNGLLLAAGSTREFKTSEDLFAIAPVATTARVLRIG